MTLFALIVGAVLGGAAVWFLRPKWDAFAAKHNLPGEK